MTRCVLLAFLFLALPANAQVNTEQYRPEEAEDGVQSLTTLSANLRTGNVELLSLQASEGLTWQKGKDTFFLVAQARYGAKRTRDDQVASPETTLLDNEARYSNDLLAHLRHNRLVGGALTWEIFSQVEVNEFLLLDRRLLGGTGPRFRLSGADTTGLYLGTAWMLEQERLNTEAIAASEPATALAHRWSSYITGTVAIGEGASASGTFYLQPRFDRFEDIRVLAEASLDASVTDRLTLGIGFRMRHDSEPPQVADGEPSLLATDLELSNSLQLTF